MKAVILAGGLGNRLRPFTQVIPKPLLPIGESSVLEIQILSLKKYGIDEFIIATNYMSDYVQAFLGNGEKYGVSIKFSKEKKPLGTCGPLKLLKKDLKEPFFLMNGDILTTLDFSHVYRRALDIDSNLLVVTKEITTPFHFGSVICNGDYIIDIAEKPGFKMEILTGIYVGKPSILEMIPEDTYYGMDTLIKEMLLKNMKIAKYLTEDYWLDIGQNYDYQKAQDDYIKHFKKLRDPDNSK